MSTTDTDGWIVDSAKIVLMLKEAEAFVGDHALLVTGPACLLSKEGLSPWSFFRISKEFRDAFKKSAPKKPIGPGAIEGAHCVLCLANVKKKTDAAREDDADDDEAELAGDVFRASYYKCKTGSTALKKHLQSKHKINLDFKANQSKKRAKRSGANGESKLKRWKEDAVKMCVELGLPISILKSDQFLNMSKSAAELSPGDVVHIQSSEVYISCIEPPAPS